MTLLRIDADDTGALHERIAAAVRRAVIDGSHSTGDRLPAARDLADALGVNINTVLRAYRDLRDQGVIELRRGRGAVVRAGAVDRARLDTLVDELATEAARLGLTASDLTPLLHERLHHGNH